MTYRWYDLPIKEVLALLRTDAETGLGRKEAAQRRREDGKNVIHPVQKAPIRGYLLQVISDLTALLLLFTAALAVIYRRDAGAITMLALLAVNYTITILSYVRAQKRLESMGKETLPTAKVMRMGKISVIDGENVVQGDILHLSAGDMVPCDARLIDSEDLYVLEGNLFDSDKATLKDASFERVGRLRPEQARNLLYASTVVLSGRCRAVAVATGPDTLVCRTGKNRPIAACHKLDVVRRLKTISSYLGLGLLAPVFLLTLLSLARGGAVIEVFLSSLAVAVAAMPEMYTAFAYVAVSHGMEGALREKDGGAFIKNPLALPSLRELDCVLLPMESFTPDRFLTLSTVFDGNEECALSGAAGDSALRVLRYGILSTGLYGASRLISFNRDGENVYTAQEEAMLRAGEICGVYNRSLEDEYPLLDHRREGEDGSVFETSLVHFRSEDVVVLRGSPEEVIARCTSYVRKGRIYEMDAYARTELLAFARSARKQRRSPVAIATKTSAYNTLLRIVDSQSDLIFEGFLLFEKPFLPGAAQQILKLRNAGVRVLAYSADESEEYRLQAQALGIVSDEKQIARSSDLEDTDEAIFRMDLPKYSFFEGFSPVQLHYAIEVLRDEYDLKIGMMGRSLEDVYPMYELPVGFSEEQGKQLGSVKEKESDLHDPVYLKKNASGTLSCQALNAVSDVILPSSDGSGRGGVNAVACAIAAARWIYRNIGVLLIYLAFGTGLRLGALLFGEGGGLLLPAQTLLLGCGLDLAAAFVIAFSLPQGSFAPVQKNEGSAGRDLLRLLPAWAAGLLFAGATAALSGILQKSGVLAAGSGASFAFCTAYLLQFSCLTMLLRTGKPVLKDVKISLPYALCFAGSAAFFALCWLIPAVGGFFSFSFAGWLPFALSLSLALLPAVVFFLLRLFGQRRKKKETRFTRF